MCLLCICLKYLQHTYLKRALSTVLHFAKQGLIRMHGHVMIEHAIDPRQLFEIFGLAVAGWKCQVLDFVRTNIDRENEKCIGFFHNLPKKAQQSLTAIYSFRPWPLLSYNYTSVDPKQFTVSKFRLKPVILISECFCPRCGHTNQTPTPHMKGDNRRQRERRPLQSPRRRPHQPTPTPHMKGDNRRQRETRPLQSPRSRPHQPTPRRPDLKLH